MNDEQGPGFNASVVLLPILFVLGIVLAMGAYGHWTGYLTPTVFIITGTALMFGSGKWMVAGLGSITSEERKHFAEKYSTRPICRVTGWIFLVEAGVILFLLHSELLFSLMGAMMIVFGIFLPFRLALLYY